MGNIDKDFHEIRWGTLYVALQLGPAIVLASTSWGPGLLAGTAFLLAMCLLLAMMVVSATKPASRFFAVATRYFVGILLCLLWLTFQVALTSGIRFSLEADHWWLAGIFFLVSCMLLVVSIQLIPTLRQARDELYGAQ